MTTARSKLVDLSATRWYHCISRCVRGARLLEDSGGPPGNRKRWIENRLQELNAIFAVSVGGFAALDNHLHVLVRLDPDDAHSWDAREVVERWSLLCPLRGKDGKRLTGTKLEQRIQQLQRDHTWVTERRSRLCSLSWFMKYLKEPLARMANKADNCRGAFFEGRFKSVAILDENALLAVCAYIDLNPVAAGLAPTPEKSLHTSVKMRIDHVRRQGRLDDLQAAGEGSVAGSRAAEALEEALWLVPIEDRRRLDSKREGMLECLPLGSYLMLVEYTGRRLRDGKAVISAEVTDILARLGSTADDWQSRIEQLQGGRLIGNFLASSQDRLQQVAHQLGLTRLVNLCGVPV